MILFQALFLNQSDVYKAATVQWGTCRICNEHEMTFLKYDLATFWSSFLLGGFSTKRSYFSLRFPAILLHFAFLESGNGYFSKAV